MLRHFSSVKRHVIVDECPQCAGIWLDAGELASLRTEFRTEAESQQAAEAYFEDVFGKQFAALRAKQVERAESAKKIAQAFRLVCPSNYLPGKQKWGAF